MSNVLGGAAATASKGGAAARRVGRTADSRASRPSGPRQRYGVYGIGVDVLGETPVLGAIHAALAHLGIEPVAGGGEAADVVLRCSAEPGAVRVPAGARAVAEQGGIRAWSRGGALYLGCDGHACRLDLAGGAGEVMVPPPPRRPRKDILTYALLLLLRRRGLFALHASGVARDGAGCLFVARSGSGKSTQTYALVRQGWEYLSDDALLLRARGEQVEALALRRDLCLDPALARAFPEVTAHGVEDSRSEKGKRRLAMRALHPERLIDGCVPRLLVFPEIVSAPVSRMVPLRPAEALRRLVGESVVVALDPAVMPAHLAALGALVRQARSWRLLAGRDLEARPELVAPLIEDARASFIPLGTP